MKKQIFTIILLLIAGTTSFGQFKLDGGVSSVRLQTAGVDRLYVQPVGATGFYGNIGINTILPTAKLEVNGDIKVSAYSISPTKSSTLDPLDRQSKSYISISAAAGVITTINGITAPVAFSGNQPYGTVLYLSTGLGATLILKNNAADVPANAINTYNGADVTISGRGGVTLIYDVDGWRMIGGAL